MAYKRKLIIAPKGFMHSEADKTASMAISLKDRYDVYVLAANPCEFGASGALRGDNGDVRVVDSESSYGHYLKYTAEYAIDFGALNMAYKVSGAQKWVSVWGMSEMPLDIAGMPHEERARYSIAYDEMVSFSRDFGESFFRGELLYRNNVRTGAGNSSCVDFVTDGFDSAERGARDVIVLVGCLNTADWEHEMASLIAREAEERYSARAMIIGVREFPYTESETKIFDDTRFCYRLAATLNNTACRSILSHTDGSIISLSGKAAKYYSAELDGRRVLDMSDPERSGGGQRGSDESMLEEIMAFIADSHVVAMDDPKKGSESAVPNGLGSEDHSGSPGYEKGLAEYIVQERKSLRYLKKNGHRPMVSIVIPCYNSNGTIQKAVNSVLSQGYKNTEIIIVEDGSDEPSCPKAGWLRRRKIKRFSKQHEGPGTARNLGVEHAAGEYILFLDADDELYVGAIANMLHYAVRHGLDIVAGVTLRESVDEKLSVSNKQLFTKNHIDKSATRDILYFDTVSTNKLYRADFLAANSIRFGPGLYEDMAFTAQAYSLADRIGIISLYVYRWMLRGAGSSVTHTLDIDNLRSRIDALNEQYRYIPEYLRCRWLAFFLYRHMDIYMKQFDTYSEAARKEMYESMRGFFALYRRHYYPKYFRRPLKRLLAESILQGEYGLFCSIGHIEAQAFGYS